MLSVAVDEVLLQGDSYALGHQPDDSLLCKNKLLKLNARVMAAQSDSAQKKMQQLHESVGHGREVLMRLNEWFVPGFGSPRFRAAVGLLFLPYTGMVLAFTIIGSMLAETVHWDRVAAILAIYFLGLGIGAHALDALGSREARPWGTIFSNRQLRLIAAGSVVSAYGIGIPYMLGPAPQLWWIAIAEGFFLLAYNLEWLHGRFHTDGWFALSWGALPVLAGYILQTNSIGLPALLIAAAAGALSLVEIKASRPYKRLKRAAQLEPASRIDSVHMRQFEAILQSVSLGVILLGLGLLAWRWTS